MFEAIERTAIWRAVRRFKTPVSAEKRSLLAQRWRQLPTELRTGWQVLGQQIVHCAYTMGPAKCSFGCTHCYLPANANQVPLPSLAEMKEQILANRRLIGPDGGLQITGGDVVDAYWEVGRGDELIEILRFADESGVVPMLMTHGQVLLEQPDYLARLVTEGGLRKVAIHIDTTQAGRRGYPIKSLRSETDLNPLRDAFVDLILDVQRRTGVRFFAAHTVTVTEGNIGSIGEIFRWLMADRRRARAFRMISLQTEADVGRTRMSASPVTPERTWAEVCCAVGTDLPRDNLWFGHPDCSNMTTLLVDHGRGAAANLIPADDRSRRFWTRILEVYGGVGSRGKSHLEANCQRLALTLRHPTMLVELARYLAHRLRHDIRLSLLGGLLRGRVSTLNVVMHNFMSEAMVNGGGEEIEKRLAACSFQGAVKREGEWHAVPMCAMNARDREKIYRDEIAAVRTNPSPLPVLN